MTVSNPITDAVGTLKLVGMHFNAPTAYPAEILQDAAAECIERLSTLPPASIALAELYTHLLAITPRSWLPHVTLTTDPTRPFGAVVTDEAGNVAARGTGKTIEGLVALVRARLPAGCGEAHQ
ncbi:MULTISPECIES: hypothetical protein [Pseudomonas]|uniref:Uncharacterized protein n=1 Tax=Pseudomonas nitroreducens TaxID=46680 RepID=A0A6G6IQ51_PSENT|nr:MULTISPECIES: hypothetical protein [Pseudomonas]MDU4250504.1 hypothetical protein [Pseudomonas sp.]QIE84950.1 hypothetical protein G5B91_01160 [Pseudomonas nitroreducens]